MNNIEIIELINKLNLPNKQVLIDQIKSKGLTPDTKNQINASIDKNIEEIDNIVEKYQQIQNNLSSLIVEFDKIDDDSNNKIKNISNIAINNMKKMEEYIDQTQSVDKQSN